MEGSLSGGVSACEKPGLKEGFDKLTPNRSVSVLPGSSVNRVELFNTSSALCFQPALVT